MKDRNKIIKFIELISLILLYYISGKNSLFIYVITLSLYNIYLSCFSHITIKGSLKKTSNDYSKFKILVYSSLSVIVVCLLFIVLSILMSDTLNILLNIKNTFLPYIIMSISVMTEPLIKLSLEYLESYNKPKLSNRLLNTYYILERIFLITIALLSITIFKLPIYISISLLYLSKVLSLIFVGVIIYLVLKKQKLNLKKEQDKISYKKEIKGILKNNSHKSVIYLVKKSYYYISVIILYTILSSKYSYSIDLIENTITFIYLYALSITNFIIDNVLSIIKNPEKKTNVINQIIHVFRCMLRISIVIAITSPLICKIIFTDNSNSIYLMMFSFLSIFISLYNITFDNIKNKKIIYTSLIIGIISKIILVVPLIHSFYRMGYNLVYGDVISTIISMFISVIINYIYLKNRNTLEKTLEKILTTLYENILLCIILVILQFIIPIRTNSYIMAVIYLLIYISISIIFIKFQKEKRG